MKERQYKNQCLDDPPDPYRTCLTRSSDPEIFDLNAGVDDDGGRCEAREIRRNVYNLGAQLYKKGRPYPEGVPGPYKQPYSIVGREVRTAGSMHVSLFEVAKKVCMSSQ